MFGARYQPTGRAAIPHWGARRFRVRGEEGKQGRGRKSRPFSGRRQWIRTPEGRRA